MFGMFKNIEDKKSPTYLSFDQLKEIALSNNFDLFFEKVYDLRSLTIEQLSDLQKMLYAEKNRKTVAMGNKALASLTLLEKISEVRELNQDEKITFRIATGIFAIPNRIKISASDNFIGISLSSSTDASNYQLLFLFPENEVYDSLPDILKDNQHSSSLHSLRSR